MADRHGGQILVDQLSLHGVNRVFSVPGESFLAALDGMVDRAVENIVARQEGGAAMMAEAHGKMTGAPGVLFVTRGPGACNASAGLHVAMHDGTPMVVFVGLIPEAHKGRGAFQEFDLETFFAPISKWAATVPDTARLPEYIDRAFATAMAGQPGPVVLGLPEDMLSARADVPDRPAGHFAAQPEASNFCELALNALNRAERPLVIAGGPIWSQKAADDLARFADALDLPVAVPFRRQGHMDNTHANYIGDLAVGMNPKLAQAVRDADCILALGTRLGDIATASYTLIDPDNPGKTLIHVHADAAEIGRVYAPQLSFTAPAPVVIGKLARMARPSKTRRDWTAQCRANYEAWQVPAETPGRLKMEKVVSWLSANLDSDAILTNGAGNYAGWLHRYYSFRRYGTQLAPTSGSMGYGLPAAIAAALEHPNRTVVCLAGDGCLQMTVNELSTAHQYGAKVIVLVVNNGRYGTIRMHQERSYPGRTSGTDLANPDFAALAQAYGGHGEVLRSHEDFPEAFARSKASGTFAVLELRVDPEALSTGMTLSEARALGERENHA